ncbi:hypothetical protein G9U51_08285 [Calidifontibacter sp. DB0510]|uniref:Uncharacterized protein n=1 Tax=Metallococcus carri TaxID=1656884 RepID=A0A967EH06_9MICO|nr:hypothetical protein [Metallococcus carri]NHN55773.1 hypothetical protein [Metallococcus carri]NOP38538.1 hypothetical protein [Calidifontibacter sp. DB2511S]
MARKTAATKPADDQTEPDTVDLTHPLTGNTISARPQDVALLRGDGWVPAGEEGGTDPAEGERIVASDGSATGDADATSQDAETGDGSENPSTSTTD